MVEHPATQVEAPAASATPQVPPTVERSALPRKPLVQERDQKENVADKIRIIKVTIDEVLAPGNTTPGTYIHIKWRNDTGRPIREVKGTLRITDDYGNEITGAPTDIWLYSDTEPIMPGKTYVSHDYVGGPTNIEDTKPSRDNLRLDYATEASDD